MFTVEARDLAAKAVDPVKIVAEKWGTTDRMIHKDFLAYLAFFWRSKDLEDQCKHMEMLRKDMEKAQKNTSKETAGTMETSFTSYKETVEALVKTKLTDMEPFKGMCDAWIKAETVFNECAKEQLEGLGSGNTPS